MDVALHKLPVTFVLDRAGITGEDGASHNGMWDMSILQVVPGLSIAAPRDGVRLRELLREAVAISDGPSVVRYPKGRLGPDLPAIAEVGRMDVLRRDEAPDVLVVAFGAMAATAMDLADRVADHGIGVTVVDPRWAKPLDEALPKLAAGYRLVVTLEDNGRVGGCGAAVAQALRDAGIDTPLRDFGIPQRFLEHGKRDQVLDEIGLSAQDLARRVTEAIAQLEPALEAQPAE
jgi:1-deoxy-D-xylulose-5-phosphate synthase